MPSQDGAETGYVRKLQELERLERELEPSHHQARDEQARAKQLVADRRGALNDVERQLRGMAREVRLKAKGAYLNGAALIADSYVGNEASCQVAGRAECAATSLILISVTLRPAARLADRSLLAQSRMASPCDHGRGAPLTFMAGYNCGYGGCRTMATTDSGKQDHLDVEASARFGCPAQTSRTVAGSAGGFDRAIWLPCRWKGRLQSFNASSVTCKLPPGEPGSRSATRSG